MRRINMMEKYRLSGKAFGFAALLILMLLLLPGCSGKDKADSANNESAAKISDYFPIKENTKYVYEGSGNEFAGYEVYVEYVSGSKIQQRVRNGGTEMARVYQIKDGKLIMKLSKGEVYYRDNMLKKEDGIDEIMLMEPLKTGTTWDIKDGIERTITGVSTEVSTPQGKYQCIEVVTEEDEGTTVHYYAKDIGLVKTIFQSGGMEVTSSLKSVELDTVEAQTVRLYIPDAMDGRIYYKEREVTYRTNDFTGRILEEAYRKLISEEFNKDISDDAYVKSLELDEENIVRIDFSNRLIADLNKAPDYEAVIHQCIADTLGDYYNSNKVIMTVEGKPYQSEHIKMSKDQAITVILEGIAEKE